jgi:hypothetical protein
MINRIQIREMLAWTALVLAILIFSFSVSFAQTKSVEVTDQNGKVHIKLEHIENGKIVKVDTTFDLDNNNELDKIIEDLTGENLQTLDSDTHDKSVIRKKNKIIIDKEISDISEKEIDNGKDFDLDFEFPEHGLINKPGPAGLPTEVSEEIRIDSLTDEDHFVIIGNENEKAPVLDKIVAGKNGKQVFVFKRSICIN